MSTQSPSLGRYRVSGEIGRGAIGTVYRAHDPVLERTVAIKTLNPDLPEELLTEMKARFVREAKSAGRLNHPNIVTVYDAGVDGGVAYIAMEYLEGKSLESLMRSGEPPSFERVADIIAQVAEGLDYASRFGIVHRDIKPANIVVSSAGVAKITDFGLARVPSSSMTQTGSILGSPKYVSPEQILEQPVDPRADIFSLGVVLYELLAGKTPFEGADDLLALLDRIAKEPAAPIATLRPDLPPGLDAILARALAKQPGERFQRAGEFARRLRELAAPAAASSQFDVDVEPSGESELAQTSLSKLLGELETFSRQAPAADELNLRLRKAFHYLEELVRRVIHANPPFAVKLDVIYLGALPAAELSNGRVECVTKKLGEVEVVDRVTLTYRMKSSRQARIALTPGKAGVLKRHLDQAKVKFDSRAVTDDAGNVQVEAFLIDIDLAATATLRGDYERQEVEIACENVGVLGPANYRVAAAEFEDAIWEFGQLLFGQPSRFAGLRLPARQ